MVGASGFIGRHAARALEAAGHEVVRCLRFPDRESDLRFDYSRDLLPEAWTPRLEGIHAVVNAAGIFRASAARLAAVHDAGPRALFAACEKSGVRTVVQISALGADGAATAQFHLSKKAADDFLRASGLDWVIVQPSIVFGAGGGSAGQLATLASLPVIPLPGNGLQRVQPIHIDDLCALLVRILADPAVRRTTIAAVGPRALTMRDWLSSLRNRMGLPATAYVPVPLSLVRLAVGEEAVRMLARGNTASPEQAGRLVSLRDPEQFGVDRVRAQLGWLLPLLRAAVALIWLVTGILSLGIYPTEESLSMLARVGLGGAVAWVALYGAAVLDLAFGAGVYLVSGKWRRWLWRAQMALIAGYSTLIAFFLPEYWLHPFGPLLKNVPLLAAILLLHELEPGERWTT